MKVGFAGAGNIAQAMARGWAAGPGGPERLLFTDAGSGRASDLAREVGGEALASNEELARSCELIILAFKPGALTERAAELEGSPAILSLLSATPLAAVAEAFPSAPVFRAMPNVAVSVRRGVICYAPAEDADPELDAEVRRALGVLGELVPLPDRSFNAATAVASCSPAYLALAAQEIARAGEAAGLEPSLVASMVARTMAGTGELLAGRSPQEVREAVASPGGSTEAGLRALEQAGAAEAFRRAVDASLARMAEQ